MSKPTTARCATCPDHTDLSNTVSYMGGGFKVAGVVLLALLTIGSTSIWNLYQQIDNIRKENLSTEKVVYEMRLNLKLYMESQGVKYVEMSERSRE